MHEMWARVDGFDGYFISDHGRVKSFKKKKPRILEGSRNEKGYRFVKMRDNGGVLRSKRIHSMVVDAFVDSSDRMAKGLVIDHIDRNPSNNHYKNLRVVTPSDNSFNRSSMSSEHRGVYQVRETQDWRARQKVDKTWHHIGTYATEEEAAQAYKETTPAIMKEILAKRRKTDIPQSKCKGVRWSKEKKKWTASKVVSKKYYFLGYHDREEDAITAVLSLEPTR
jgi:hypothetical protein